MKTKKKSQSQNEETSTKKAPTETRYWITEKELNDILQMSLAISGIVQLADIDGDEPTITGESLCALLKPIHTGLEDVFCEINTDEREVKGGAR